MGKGVASIHAAALAKGQAVGASCGLSRQEGLEWELKSFGDLTV